MFGFVRPKVVPSCPFEFTDEITIEKPAEQVYGLLDWADQRNAMRARGHLITPIDGEADTFLMTLDELPTHAFGMIVTVAVPHSSYGFTTIVTPTLGRVAQSHEHYAFTALTPDSCKVTLVHTVLFIDRMPLKHLAEEELKVSAGCHNALAKLKLQAEGNAAAVKAVSGKLIV